MKEFFMCGKNNEAIPAVSCPKCSSLHEKEKLANHQPVTCSCGAVFMIQNYNIFQTGTGINFSKTLRGFKRI